MTWNMIVIRENEEENTSVTMMEQMRNGAAAIDVELSLTKWGWCSIETEENWEISAV